MGGLKDVGQSMTYRRVGAVDTRLTIDDDAVAGLSAEGRFAIFARALARLGYVDHISGHVTVRQPDGSLLVDPYEMSWDELTPDDVMRIAPDGEVLGGRWHVTPAIDLHLDVHRLRPHISVTVHGHPRWATTYAARAATPAAYDQTGAVLAGRLVVSGDYRGPVADRDNARDAIEALQNARAALLPNHGVIVVGTTIVDTYLACLALEQMCDQAWHVEQLPGTRSISSDVAAQLADYVAGAGIPGLYAWAVRREVRHDPSLREWFCPAYEHRLLEEA